MWLAFYWAALSGRVPWGGALSGAPRTLARHLPPLVQDHRAELQRREAVGLQKRPRQGGRTGHSAGRSPGDGSIGHRGAAGARGRPRGRRGPPTCSGRAPCTGPGPCRSTSSASRGRPAGRRRSRASPTRASCGGREGTRPRAPGSGTGSVTGSGTGSGTARGRRAPPRTARSRARRCFFHKAGTINLLMCNTGHDLTPTLRTRPGGHSAATKGHAPPSLWVSAASHCQAEGARCRPAPADPPGTRGPARQGRPARATSALLTAVAHSPYDGTTQPAVCKCTATRPREKCRYRG